jgi:GT2 family glycosyltransferase
LASISVVITTFNRAALLTETLDALRQQRYETGDEVIVVDNGSTDGTSDVIACAAADLPVALRHLEEKKPGKSPALNTGIAAARGEILALTDDDVIVAEDWIESIRALFVDPSIALAGGRVDPRWERPVPLWLRAVQRGEYGQMASPLALLHYGEPQQLGGRTAVGANLAVRKRVVDGLGGFAEHLGRRNGTLLCGEDHDFCARAVAAGYQCEYRPELRVRHWVPAERTRLRYFLRWFFWSGVTNAVLEHASAAEHLPSGATPRVPRYLWRQLAMSPAAAVVNLLTGRVAKAAGLAMDAAFAFGYIRQRLNDRWRGRVAQGPATAPRVGVPSATPAQVSAPRSERSGI